jgi:hypothetical protein
LLLAVFASFAWVLATVVRGRRYESAHGGETIATRNAIARLARRLRRATMKNVEQDTRLDTLEEHEKP